MLRPDLINFTDAVLGAELPVMVCFTAKWCRSCNPTCYAANYIEADYKDKIAFIKLDVDEYSQICAQYEVKVVPSIIVFQEGKPIARAAGYQSRNSLKALLNSLSTCRVSSEEF